MARIFFDIDGVLIDGFHTKPDRRNRWDETIEQDLGIKFDQFQEIFSDWFTDALCGRIDFVKAMQHWLEERNYGLCAHEVIDYWHKKDSKVNNLVMDVAINLASLPDIFLYTATNQTHERISYLRDMMGWNAIFTDFYYSARLGCLKHEGAYFAQIEKELGFSAQSEPPLYFDDDPQNIAVAAGRGWNAVLVDTPDDIISHDVIRSLLARDQ